MVLEAGHRSLTRAIERNLHQTNIVRAVPAAAIAHYLAGSFIALVRWWLDEGGLYTPAHMDDIFQALVAPGLERALLNES